MSRAALTVPTWASRRPLPAWHSLTSWLSALSRALTPAGSTGASSTARYWSRLLPGPQRIGALRPTPRGSKPMRSKWARSVGFSWGATWGRKVRPEAPGPPGFRSRLPILVPVAGRRSMAMPMVPWSGWE